MKGVNKVTVRGRTYYYDRRTGERLPDDGIARQKRMLEIARGITAKRSNSGFGTVGDLVARYRTSPEFKKLAPSSRRTYGRYLASLENDFGDLLVKHLTREFVIELRDKMAATPNTADRMVKVLSVLLNYALDRHSQYGIEINAARDVRKIADSTPHRPWPDELVASFRKSAPPELVLVMELAAGTGQRGSDVVSLLWSQYDGQRIRLRQQKTKEDVGIPCTSTLKAILDATPRRAAVICTTSTGRSWSTNNLQKRIARAVRALGYPGYSLHGLRHRMGRLLAETGSSEHEIMAVLGHRSPAMAAHYTRTASRETLATASILKLERSVIPVLQNKKTSEGESK